MTSHVRRRREVVQQLPSATTRVSCSIRRGGGLVQLRLSRRPVGWTWRPGAIAQQPTLGHILEHPVDAHAGNASGLSRDASTQVAASRTMPPYVGVGGLPPVKPRFVGTGRRRALGPVWQRHQDSPVGAWRPRARRGACMARGHTDTTVVVCGKGGLR